MLKLLYVTGLWSGLADVLFDGQPPRGMPAFFRPLRELVERGHQVDLLVYAPAGRRLNLGVKWLKPEQFTLVPAAATVGTGSLGRLGSLWQRARRRIEQGGYNFVYGQGTLGTLGVLAANNRQVPCGQRLYGISYFTREFSDRPLNPLQRAAIFSRHALHYMAFSLPKSFLLVTNDGSRGDRVFTHIGNPRTEFLFWSNGVDFPVEHGRVDQRFTEPFLLYPGRIDRFKRQHLAVDLLRLLAVNGPPPVKLKLAGHIYDETYRREIDVIITKHGLGPYIDFLGPLSRRELYAQYDQCLAALSFYDVSNLGNVAIECLAAGVPLITLDDGTLSHIIRDGDSGFLAADLKAAAAAVHRLLKEPGLLEKVCARARIAAHEHFSPWQERVKREVDRIELAVAPHPEPGR
ncbi:glycosyltransferase family 4 protein [bacterium]|nr:glycosyltransferase family 4 protein [bacterium]